MSEESALEKYNMLMQGINEPSALERLRFFLSKALNGRDWLDVEPFLEALAEQPTQEPVAWRVLLDEAPEDTDWHYMTDECWDCFKQSAEPLYTHPKQWQGLSDEEMEYLVILNAPPVHPDFLEDDGWYEFARTIEAKLREKNDG